MEFIDLHSIFKDNSVISSITNHFNNSETPIICYKYNKPIMSSIFNLNKIVTDIKVSKGAKIRNRYNQVPHLTQDTNINIDFNFPEP